MWHDVTVAFMWSRDRLPASGRTDERWSVENFGKSPGRLAGLLPE